MDRRSFIKLLSIGLVAPVVEPKITYILPPINGWITTPLSNTFKPIPYYMEFLIEKGALVDPFLDITKLRNWYLDERAAQQVRIYESITKEGVTK